MSSCFPCPGSAQAPAEEQTTSKQIESQIRQDRRDEANRITLLLLGASGTTNTSIFSLHRRSYELLPSEAGSRLSPLSAIGGKRGARLPWERKIDEKTFGIGLLSPGAQLSLAFVVCHSYMPFYEMLPRDTVFLDRLIDEDVG